MYAGHSSFSGSTTYHFSEDGRVELSSRHVTTGLAGLRSASGKETGTVSLSPRGLLELATEVNDTLTRKYYVIRGWLEGPEQTVMQVNGPWYPRPDGTVDEDAFNPQKAVNLNARWIRKAK